MFKDIEPLLAQAECITLTIATEENGKIRVNVIPKGKGDKHLVPLTIVATAEELDGGFVAAIQQYREKTLSIAQQMDQFEQDAAAALAAAEETRKANDAKTAKVAATKATPAASKAAAPAKVKPVVESPSLDELF
ncbi:PRTRC system protein E [Acidithiobacillus ferridurans]|uniref:PRTRC system protein E n=1 Tax=Acidithiobacillus ferridurans TaxID=1232575 RepID=A0A8X8GB80_ACIFI|nr:PRTRC system protein E [Acidithiobacillus ferridurans]MBU2715584.1 PRTRC system protein E [Acidithiobacillus ferridurans]MBU2722926.1 PRTRC system protein E [Acidithiobacillus ferridurans]MBU2728182.1 PRTRC system protein E [Acidithiobacillus ferridurans]